jgi:hypothetical protein
MYSAYDLECKEYFETGKNSELRSECVHDIWLFVTEDWDDEEIETIPIREVLSYSSVEIREHKEKIK